MSNNIEKIQSLLHEINVVRVHNEAIIDATGGRFNMFRLLGVNHYENAHSIIIAEFLDPSGSHGLKEKFLCEFISQNIPESFSFECKNALVRKEVYLNELGKADIIIEQNDKKKAIIIENKIYAGDQNEQLIRYDKFAKEKYRSENYQIIYLTINGTDASDNSCSGTNYLKISYSENIIKWLEECAKISLHYPMVRETINQYINHLKQLTNQDMDTKNQNEIIEILSRKENVQEVASILNNQMAWKQEIISKYLKPALSELANEKKLIFDDTHIHRLNENESAFSFYKNNWGRFRIYFYTESQGYKNFYLGISYAEGDVAKNIQSKLDCFNSKPNKNWPYGFQYLEYRNWDNNTFVDFSKGNESEFIKYISKILDEVLHEIEDKKINFNDCD